MAFVNIRNKTKQNAVYRAFCFININLDNKGIVPSVYNSSMVLVILSTEIVFESKKCLVKSGKDISNDTWQSIT